MSRCHQNTDCRRDSGYTLIELLIVLVLVSLLMVGVWAMLRNWGGLYERGKRRTEKALLVRSLSDQITDDLHDTTYRPPGRSSKRSRRASLGEAVGLVGEKDWMVLDVLQPIAPYYATASATDADTSATATATVAGEQQWTIRAPELRRIVYWFQPHEDETEIVSMDIGEAPAFNGLVRLAVAREFFTGLAESETSTEVPTAGRTSLRSQVEMIGQMVTEPEDSESSPAGDFTGLGDPTSTTESDAATEGRPERLPGILQQDELAEVGWLEFRYYDGTVWSDSWDSRSQRRLPVAVEVKFQLVDLPDGDEAILNDEQQAEAELQDMGADQTESELDNAALLEGEAPEWAGQQEGDFAIDQPQAPPYYRCVIYLEPPKEWPEQTFAEEDEEGALGADDTGAEMTVP